MYSILSLLYHICYNRKRLMEHGRMTMKKLWVYMKDYAKESILGPLFKLLEASFELFVPLVMAAIIDTGIANGDKGYIFKMCGVLIGLAIIGSGLFDHRAVFCGARLGGLCVQAALGALCAHPETELHPAGSAGRRYPDHPHDQRHQPGAVGSEPGAAAAAALAFCGVRRDGHGVHH